MLDIVSTAAVVPSFRWNQDQLKEQYRLLMREGPRAEMVRVFDHAGIDSRHLSFGAEYYSAGHSFERRNDDYLDQAVQLGEKAVRSCLERADVPALAIDHIVAVTTTGLATPSLDARL